MERATCPIARRGSCLLCADGKETLGLYDGAPAEGTLREMVSSHGSRRAGDRDLPRATPRKGTGPREVRQDCARPPSIASPTLGVAPGKGHPSHTLRNVSYQQENSK
jgi:hypothetical protein